MQSSALGVGHEPCLSRASSAANYADTEIEVEMETEMEMGMGMGMEMETEMEMKERYHSSREPHCGEDGLGSPAALVAPPRFASSPVVTWSTSAECRCTVEPVSPRAAALVSGVPHRHRAIAGPLVALGAGSLP